MTPIEAKAFLDKLVDDHLSFNDNVEWQSGAVDALLEFAHKEWARGMTEAASYVDGNWSDAPSMAEHLEAVAAGEKPMYEA